MPETLSLTARLEQRRRQEAEIFQNLMQQQLSSFRTELNVILQHELNTIKHDTRRLNQRISWSMMCNRLVWPVLITLMLLLTVFGASWGTIQYFTGQIKTLSAQAQKMEQVTRYLESQGGKIQLSTCGPKKRLCAKIDTRAGGYGNHNEYWILKDQ